jgi:hypothetical protein
VGQTVPDYLTLECTPVDIAMSVVEWGTAVYSPAVLPLWGEVAERGGFGSPHVYRPCPPARPASGPGRTH